MSGDHDQQSVHDSVRDGRGSDLQVNAAEPLQDEQTRDSFIVRFFKEACHLRWRALILANFVTFGNYYVYDFPSSIGTSHLHSFETRFANHGKTYTQEDNQLLYSIYSWPNTVLAILGGILVDRVLGIRWASLLFSCLVLSGTIVVWLGVQSTQLWLMVAGRFIFGLGGESLSVAQSAFVARWFTNTPFMALAFGISISFVRVGSSFNFLFSPMIAKWVGVEWAALVGCGTCAMGLLATISLCLLDVSATRRGILPPLTKESGSKMRWADLIRLPVPYWLICTVCVCVYCSIFPFVGIVKNYIQVVYDLSSAKASTYASIFQFVCAGGSPVVGALVDYIGRSTYILAFANLGFAAIHGVMAITKPPPPFTMAFMGVCYSFLVSALWPLVPYCVDKSLVGFAYGVMTSMQNTGLAIFPLISGAILTKYTPPADCSGHTNSSDSSDSRDCSPLPTKEGYVWTEVLFMGIAIVGILFAVAATVYDYAKNEGALSANPKRRTELLAARAEPADEARQSAGLEADNTKEPLLPGGESA